MKVKKMTKLGTVKNTVRYTICIISVVTACYGFWGCLYPDLTLVKGTYRIVEETEMSDAASQESEKLGQRYRGDKEELYADILAGKVQVTFRSKILELFFNRRGQEND